MQAILKLFYFYFFMFGFSFSEELSGTDVIKNILRITRLQLHLILFWRKFDLNRKKTPRKLSWLKKQNWKELKNYGGENTSNK